MKNAKTYITDAVFWLAGCALYAAAVALLLEPNQISPGGFTGIATLVNFLFSVPVGTVLFLLNIPLFFLQYKKYGLPFIAKTAIVTLIASVMLDIAAAFLPRFEIDGILASAFGGIMCGAGLSLVLLRGATTGGVDVIARLINDKYPYITVGRVIMLFDFFVVGLSALVYGNIESALYSLISIFASSKIIDAMLYGGGKGKLIFIITERPDLVQPFILREIGRGVTVVDAVGGFSGRQKAVLMCAVSTFQMPAVRIAVKQKDKGAFILVADAGEIIGQGFKE